MRKMTSASICCLLAVVVTMLGVFYKDVLFAGVSSSPEGFLYHSQVLDLLPDEELKKYVACQLKNDVFPGTVESSVAAKAGVPLADVRRLDVCIQGIHSNDTKCWVNMVFRIRSVTKRVKWLQLRTTAYRADEDLGFLYARELKIKLEELVGKHFSESSLRDPAIVPER